MRRISLTLLPAFVQVVRARRGFTGLVLHQYGRDRAGAKVR